MDPPSIARIAAAGAKTLSFIADIIRPDAQSHDSVHGLDCMSRGLVRVLYQLVESLNEPIPNNQENAQMWSSIYGAIQSCKETISYLDEEMEVVRESIRNSTRLAWQACSLGLPPSQINCIILRMKTHSMNLQLALQMVNAIKTTVSNPALNTTDQSKCLKRLNRMLAEIRLYASTNNAPTAAELNHNILLIEDHDTKELCKSADIIASLMAQTKCDFQHMDNDHITLQTDESVFENYAYIVSPAPFTMQHFQSLDESSSDKNFLAESDSKSQYSYKKTISDDSSEIIVLDGYDINPLEIKSIVELIQAGMYYFRRRRFDKAQAILGHGLEYAAGLTAKNSEDLNLNFIQFCHALSCMALASSAEALRSFKLVAEGYVARKSDSQLQYFAHCELARVYLKLSQHDDDPKNVDEALKVAEKHALQAVTFGQQDFSVRKHTSYHGALSLLSLIYSAKGLQSWPKATLRLFSFNLWIPECQFEEMLTFLTTDNYFDSWYQGYPSIASATSIARRLSDTERLAAIIQTMSSFIDLYSMRKISLDGRHKSTATIRSSDTEWSASGNICRKRANKRVNKKRLFRATQHGDLHNLNALLEQMPIDLNSQKVGIWNTTTVLKIAATKGHYLICERLLVAGAAINAIVDGCTALDAAIDEGHLEICHLFLRHGSNLSGMTGQRMTPLLRAVSSGNRAIRELVTASVKDIDDAGFLRTRKMRTALMQCAAYNRTKIISGLLELGANPNGPDSSINTPLIEAARANAIEAARLLLECGADLYLRTAKGITATSAARGWLKGFFLAWPESRDWKEPSFTMILQP